MARNSPRAVLSMATERRTTAPSEGPARRTGRGVPAWDLALLFPLQGDWSEEAFLELEQNSGNRMMELVNGVLEILPMPDPYHQRLVRFLFLKTDAAAEAEGSGEAFTSPLPVRLWKRQFREPDVLFVRAGRIKDPHKPPRGADLAMEVVSPGKENRERDLVTKRKEYARAKIGEYWIVDGKEKTVTVLALAGRSYRVHGVFKPGDQATSKVLPGLTVDVSALFAAAEGKK